MVNTVTVKLRSGKTAELKRPERADFPANLGGAVQYALANVIIWIAETSGEALGTFGGSALTSFLEAIEPGLVKYYAPLIDELLSVPELPGVLRTFLTELKSPTSEAGAALLDTVAGGAVSSVTSSLFGALTARWTYAVNRATQGARPGVADALTMMWRDPASYEAFRGWLLDQGWSPFQIDKFIETMRPRLPVPDLLAWAWRVNADPMTVWDELGKRGFGQDELNQIVEMSRNLLGVPDLLNWAWRVNLDPATVKDEIVRRGYDPTDADRFIELSRNRLSVNDIIQYFFRTTGNPNDARDFIVQQGYPPGVADQYLELAKFIAPVQDLIRMAVREAFSPEIAEQFGQYEDFPPDFAAWGEKLGMSEEWAKRYWAAHWDLPSPSMGFEMLHRGIITHEELKLLLRALDVMPFWRDKLVQMSYTPFTRVDVRRMHKLGVLSDADLITAYKDIGYDDTKATQLALFTIRLNSQEETEFTVSNILAGYNAGVITSNEAFALLIDMGKSEEYAAYLITVEDYEREKKLLSERIDYIKTQYVNSEISLADANARLGELDIESERVKRFLDSWTIQRNAKVAVPTLAQIEEYYKDGILSEAQARVEIGKRRYPDYWIELMIQDWDQQIVDAARKEAERTQKEQERVAKAEFRTKRTVALANLNAQIAEARLFVAELKLAKYGVVTAEEKDEITQAIAATNVEIAELQLRKAQLPIIPE